MPPSSIGSLSAALDTLSHHKQSSQPGFAHRENKEPLFIDLQALSLTLGWVTDVVLTIVMSFPRTTLSTSKKMAVLRAFNKVVWIQQVGVKCRLLSRTVTDLGAVFVAGSLCAPLHPVSSEFSLPDSPELTSLLINRTDEEAAVNLARINAEKASEQERGKEKEEEAVENKMVQLAVENLPEMSL